jgi:hypothetical protein
MSLLPLGLLSQGGGAGGVDGFVLISSTVLGTAQASVVFSSIPSTFSGLQLRVVGRSAQSAAYDDLVVRVNGDTGTNYGHKNINFSTTATTSTNGNSVDGVRLVGIHANTSPADNFGAMIIDIMGNNVTTRKTSLRGFGGGFIFNGNFEGAASVTAGVWNNTAVVTSLTVSTNSASNLMAGSRVSLYGVL